MRAMRRRIREAGTCFQCALLMTLILCYPAEADLVSYWPANGNFKDTVGTNHGVAVDTVNFSAGRIGEACDLATTGYISITNPVAGGLESVTGFTVTAWIRRSGIGQPWGTASLANLRTTLNVSGFSIEEVYQQPNSMAFYVNTTGGTPTLGTQGIISTGWVFGVFHHLAATFDAETHTMVLYRDGEVVASRDDVTNTQMIANAASAFQIGRNIVNDSRWNGLIDELHFYNATLSQADIRQVMNSVVMQEPEVRSDSSVVIRWSSFTNHVYTLHHSTNLLSDFSVLEGNIQGNSLLNSYTDTVDGTMMKCWKVTTED